MIYKQSIAKPIHTVANGYRREEFANQLAKELLSLADMQTSAEKRIDLENYLQEWTDLACDYESQYVDLCTVYSLSLNGIDDIRLSYAYQVFRDIDAVKRVQQLRRHDGREVFIQACGRSGISQDIAYENFMREMFDADFATLSDAAISDVGFYEFKKKMSNTDARKEENNE